MHPSFDLFSSQKENTDDDKQKLKRPFAKINRRKEKTNRRSVLAERRNNCLSCLSTEMLLMFIAIV